VAHAAPAEVAARVRVLTDGRPRAGAQQGAKAALSAAQAQHQVHRDIAPQPGRMQGVAIPQLPARVDEALLRLRDAWSCHRV